MSVEDSAKVMAERKRLNIRLCKGDKGIQNPGGGKSVKALKKQNNTYKSQIKALERKMKTKDDDDDKEDESDVSDDEQDAGDSFGGPESKKA